MKRHFVVALFFLAAFLFCESGFASRSKSRSKQSNSNGGGFNFYMAAGPNLVMPTSVRLGWGRWEIGILGRNFIGANKTFLVPNSAVYSGFGLGVGTGSSGSLGFQASVGVHYDWFWGIGFRAEMIANADLVGTAAAYGLVGVSYGF